MVKTVNFMLIYILPQLENFKIQSKENIIIKINNIFLVLPQIIHPPVALDDLKSTFKGFGTHNVSSAD